jgi:UDP-N-acetyl-D-mannosaminuronate dehydrogenase
MMTGGPGTGGSCVQNPWYLWYGEHGQGRAGDIRRRPRRR